VYFKKADFEKLISIAGQHNPDMWLENFKITFPPFPSHSSDMSTLRSHHCGILALYFKKKCYLWYPKRSYNKKKKFPWSGIKQHIKLPKTI
jgi:hypothetical protein